MSGDFEDFLITQLADLQTILLAAYRRQVVRVEALKVNSHHSVPHMAWESPQLPQLPRIGLTVREQDDTSFFDHAKSPRASAESIAESFTSSPKKHPT